MRIYRDYRLAAPDATGAVLAIGNFDGIHLGHQAIVAAACAQAELLGVRPALMTFEPHPRRYFQPEKQTLRLMPFHDKVRLLGEYGIECLIAQRFNAAFASLDAAAFIREVLIDGLGVSHVVTGEDFVFGRARSGDAGTLQQAAQDTGAFGYTALSLVGDAAQARYSSSAARGAIAHGEMEEAARILGRPYGWSSRVVHGDQRGRGLGFPTANLLPPPVLLPPVGVYAVRVQLDSAPEHMNGVANLGYRPTVGGTHLRLEIHLFDREMDLYSKRLRVEFWKFIRPEQTFEGTAALQQQITRDCQEARTVLSA